jgi:hypothetical protein
MVKNSLQNTILIKCMAAARLNMNMVAVIGGISRSVIQKDMGHTCILVEIDTWGN